jgi:hypothetical protein
VNFRKGCPRPGYGSSRAAAPGAAGNPVRAHAACLTSVFPKYTLIRLQVAKPAARLAHIAEAEVALQYHVRLARSIAGMQVECLVLYAPPQPLDERIFDPAALAVHIEPDRPQTGVAAGSTPSARDPTLCRDARRPSSCRDESSPRARSGEAPKPVGQDARVSRSARRSWCAARGIVTRL